MIAIYKITSPSEKIYIGQSIDIEKRFRKYKSLKCEKQVKLYNSFIKYGIENHTFEIIKECEIHELNYYERHYQEYYNVLGEYGLNLVYVSLNGKKIISEETRKKMSESGKGRKVSVETRLKISKKNKGKIVSQESRLKISEAQKKLRLEGKGVPPPVLNGKNNGMFGKKHSKESIKKMKNNKIVKKGETHPNSLIYMHIETGFFYFSLREVAEALNKSYNYVADRIFGKVKVNNLNIIKT
jgi:group I intron endonuclease